MVLLKERNFPKGGDYRVADVVGVVDYEDAGWHGCRSLLVIGIVTLQAVTGLMQNPCQETA
jgi:hypothetical protein